jgi:hypothetical protein
MKEHAMFEIAVVAANFNLACHMIQPTWTHISELLLQAGRLLSAQWQCGFPDPNQVVSQADEAALDIYARHFAQFACEPPHLDSVHLRPWFLARIAAALARAKLGNNKPIAPFGVRTVLEEMLTSYWHAQGKLFYQQLPPDQTMSFDE